MVSWEITKEEIESLWQFFELQGGSKYRKEEGQKALDRIMARDPLPEKSAKPEVPVMPETTIHCPYCGTGNKFYRNQIDRPCGNCGKGYFRVLPIAPIIDAGAEIDRYHDQCDEPRY